MSAHIVTDLSRVIVIHGNTNCLDGKNQTAPAGVEEKGGEMKKKDRKLKTPTDIVQKIMEQHLDLAACQCWICKHGRDMGVRCSFDSGFERMPMVVFNGNIVI